MGVSIGVDFCGGAIKVFLQAIWRTLSIQWIVTICDISRKEDKNKAKGIEATHPGTPFLNFNQLQQYPNQSSRNKEYATTRSDAGWPHGGPTADVCRRRSSHAITTAAAATAKYDGHAAPVADDEWRRPSWRWCRSGRRRRPAGGDGRGRSGLLRTDGVSL